MTRRLFTVLRGDDPRYVTLSRTGRANRALSGALVGYYADRVLLVWSFVWLGLRWARYHSILQRPEELYEPMTWLGALAFPTLPSWPVWYTLAAICALSIAACLWRPRLIVARVTLAASALLLMTLEFGHGKIEHPNHLFLLAHTLAIFLPIGRPAGTEEAQLQSRSDVWYRAALLLPYTMAGLWKWVDMTVRQVVKPGVTWLNPDALAMTSISTYYNYDLPLDVPTALAPFGPLYVVGYVGLAFIFAASSVAAFRRPLLPLILFTIVAFHSTNVLTLFVHFITTCIVAAILFFPYERVLPQIRRARTAVDRRSFEGHGLDATYVRRYENGDADRFRGFYAYRARLEDRSWLLASPLFYPGVATVSTWILKRKYADSAPYQA